MEQRPGEEPHGGLGFGGGRTDVRTSQGAGKVGERLPPLRPDPDALQDIRRALSRYEAVRSARCYVRLGAGTPSAEDDGGEGQTNVAQYGQDGSFCTGDEKPGGGVDGRDRPCQQVEVALFMGGGGGEVEFALSAKQDVDNRH